MFKVDKKAWFYKNNLKSVNIIFYCYFISGVSQLKMVFLTFVNLFYLAVNKTIVYLTTLLFYKQNRCNKRVC